MPAKTILPDSDLKHILLGYDLGDLIESQSFSSGTVQTNLKLVTTDGLYALRLYENRSADYIRFELELLKYLSARQYPCPEPIPDMGGNLLNEFHGKPVAIFSFMSGIHDEDSNHHTHVAAMIGKLHSLTENLQLANQASRDTYDPEACLRYALDNLRKLPSTEEAAARSDWLRRQLDDVALPETLPTGICHCDANPTNFLYGEGRISAVLDFDMAASLPLIYDLGSTIYWWASPGGRALSLSRAREIVEAYETERPLCPLEKDHLYDALKMVMLMSSGWFADADDFWTDTGGVDCLNVTGRSRFRAGLFG